MKATAAFFGVFLTAITFGVGDVAWDITMTLNEQNIGGLLIFGWITASPVVFYALGFCYPHSDKRTVEIGETYYRS